MVSRRAADDAAAAQPAERAKAVYPLAVSLRETLRAYDAANARLVAPPPPPCAECARRRSAASVQAAEPAADCVPLLVASHKLATQVDGGGARAGELAAHARRRRCRR